VSQRASARQRLHGGVSLRALQAPSHRTCWELAGDQALVVTGGPSETDPMRDPLALAAQQGAPAPRAAPSPASSQADRPSPPMPRPSSFETPAAPRVAQTPGQCAAATSPYANWIQPDCLWCEYGKGALAKRPTVRPVRLCVHIIRASKRMNRPSSRPSLRGFFGCESFTLECRKKEDLRNAAWPQAGAKTLSTNYDPRVREALTTSTRATASSTSIARRSRRSKST
jgi:hypothetical protein